jgi:pimeloyl-ACP methyl ester carboxylesterase
MTPFTPELAITVPNRHGEPLHTTATIPSDTFGGTARPLLLILHGFKGFRNYSFLPWIAQAAAAHGLIAVRMCFSRNGMGNTSWMVQDMAAFAANTISHEVDDVHDVLRALTTDPAFAPVRERWDGGLYLTGHSRGGGVAQVASRELHESGSMDLRRTVVLNSVGTWVRWTPRQRAVWQEAGGFTFLNERTKQELRMDLTYVDDIERNADRLSLDQAAYACGARLAFVHAEADLTVPLNEIIDLRARSRTEAPLHVISNTTHTFGMTHPVDRITHGFVDALNTSLSWLLA